MLFRSNSTLMLLPPVEEEEEIDLTPSMPLRARSKGSVICDSITSADTEAIECTAHRCNLLAELPIGGDGTARNDCGA